MGERREGTVLLQIQNENDQLSARLAVRDRAQEVGLRLANQTKLLTATSAIIDNALTHGGGGTVGISTIYVGDRVGVEVVVEDRGPGIADVELALTDNYSSADGPGLGLGGARRLVDDFALESTMESGTRVAVICWRAGEG